MSSNYIFIEQFQLVSWEYSSKFIMLESTIVMNACKWREERSHFNVTHAQDTQDPKPQTQDRVRSQKHSLEHKK